MSEEFMTTQVTRKEANQLLDEMLELRAEVLAEGNAIYERWAPRIKREAFHGGAQNLAYYLALRQRDLTPLQNQLNRLGLSALGWMESRVTATLDSIILSLAQIAGREEDIVTYPKLSDFSVGHKKLRRNAEALFGPVHNGQTTSIMVTVDQRGAEDYKFVRDLLLAGANILRLNCAHGNPESWQQTLDNLRRAEAETGIACRLHVDIAGPKVRTSWLLVHEQNNLLRAGDRILLVRGDGVVGQLPYAMQVGISLPQVIADLDVGQKVLFDDGIIRGKVVEVNSGGAVVEITKTNKKKGNHLLTHKGINLPDTDLDLPVLTDHDMLSLDFAVAQADSIGFSFIKNREDLAYCIDEVEKRLASATRATLPGIVAKIETVQGMANLADILAEGSGRCNFGIMVARGDLAIESGFLALAEFQELILWLCEAADTPAIWATDVLASMAATGLPTRAEISDAALGGARAECVMLHAGDYIQETVVFLRQILQRRGKSLYKKTPLLPPLDFKPAAWDESP